MDILSEAKKVFEIEIFGLQILKDSLDSTFIRIIDIITTNKGKVIVTGVGKSGYIGRKIASTFSSLGTPSFYLHPSEALHGDLGVITSDDIVIAVSNSGESEEITRLISTIKLIGAKLIGITSNNKSTLALHCDVVQIMPKAREACYLGIAPTTSTTQQIVFGDSLAVTASIIYGYNEDNFSVFHPAGTIGKRLLIKTSDLMKSKDNNPIVFGNVKLKDAVIELGKKGLGIVSVCDSENVLLGVITDGDLRRQLEIGSDIYSMTVNEIMSKKPITIKKDSLAVEALKILKEKNVSSAPVIDDKNCVVGTIRIQDIIKAGIIL